ncbi:hypothetical protein DOY81_002241, partial [Sarcophaga bullata]
SQFISNSTTLLRRISIVMRIFVVLFAVVAAASAASIAIDYLPPVADNSLPVQEYIPPESDAAPATLTDDGYRYKTVRKLKLRHRRDVNELPANEYLPPTEAAQEELVEDVQAPEEKTELAEDGYRYKTVRRLKYRQRRDVNELPANEYLPPTEAHEEVVEEVAVPEEKTELTEDGYRYKTVRRLKYRQRRDVNELPANEYLPPAEVAQEEVVEEVAVPEQKTELAEDGYRYKTVRRLKYRQRRDFSELPANEYLPPTEAQEELVEEVAVPEEKTELAEDELAEDGYRYKTVRRLKYRQRRDVSELPANEYLPPTEAQEELVEEVAVPEEKTELAEDGYRYKTVRRLKYRQRRDVNELPANEYLPPTEAQEQVAEEAAVPEEKTELAEDGYRYKTVRRLKYRQRRDVNELPANEYLPPTEVAQEEVVVEVAVPEEKTELAEDGYRYKAVRRLKYRQRRDVNELPANEYLPPTEAQEEVVEELAVPEEKTELAEDGYRYKTVRRLKYRQRRDVNELPANEYLPPTEEVKEELVEEVAAPEEKTELAEDGYRYKTVRSLKYRHRRDVNELPANEYLPPTEAQEEVVEEVVAPEEKTELAEDGYRYKTVRRLKYRQRRDVSELPANEYLPPTEAQEELVEEIAVPEEKTELAEDGYRYKTVRRLKYRQRRDVNELPANEYLPPTEAQEEVVEEVVAPEEKTELAEDGYRYKTVRRLKYRQRRDVNELPANEYLPPTEEVKEELVEEVTVPEEKTELAEDGYRYKTVRRLKYRQRRDVNELPANEYLPPSNAEATDLVVAIQEPVESAVLADDGYRYKSVRKLKFKRH